MASLQMNEPVWLDNPPTHGDKNWPEWYRQFQTESWARFESLPTPSRKDENWRYADLKKSRFEKLYPNGGNAVSESIKETASDQRPTNSTAHFVFVNGRLIDNECGELPDGVEALSMEEAICQQDLSEYFQVDADRLGGEKFAALNGSADVYGLYLKVESGVELAGPISIQHFVSGDSAPVFPRTLILAGNHSKARVVESFSSLDDKEPGLCIGVCDLYADDGATINHAIIQNLNTCSKQVHLSTSFARRDATVQTVMVNLGGAWIRNESINAMTDQGSRTEIYGANLANGIQEFDQRTFQVHDAQHTTSDLLIKNALYDKSRAIFGGLIQVKPGAHHTDSYQSCRSLLGSEEAEINAMPGLEIDADQVKCSHGATSGQISDEEIFYLRSRGIPKEQARRIVSCGFLLEALARTGDSDLNSWLSNLIEQKFDRL